MEMCIAEIFIK